jgi:hypothetical protein
MRILQALSSCCKNRQEVKTRLKIFYSMHARVNLKKAGSNDN